MRDFLPSTGSLLVLLLSLSTGGCLTTLGAMRGAETIPRGRAELGGRVVTNAWTWAGVGSVRYGLLDRLDIEGFAFAATGYEGATGGGAGVVVTYQLPAQLDWLAVGVNGVTSSYANQIGGRVIAGTNPYIAFEHNVRSGFDTERTNMVMAGVRLGDHLVLEAGAFPIMGENDFFVHAGLGFVVPLGDETP